MTSRPARAALARPSETALVAGLRAGDPGSREDLVRFHGGRMLAVIRRIVQSEDDARHCLQEAFLQAFRGIDGFEEGYRTVLMLRDIEGYSTEETAALLDLTPGTAKIRLHRARRALKTLLERTMGEGRER